MFLDRLFKRKQKARSFEEFVELAGDGYDRIWVHPAVVVKRAVDTAAVGPIGDHHYTVDIRATGAGKRELAHTVHLDDIQRFGSVHALGDFDERRAANVKHGLRTEKLMKRLRLALPHADVWFVSTYGHVVEDPKPMFAELHEYAEANGIAV